MVTQSRKCPSVSCPVLLLVEVALKTSFSRGLFGALYIQCLEVVYEFCLFSEPNKPSIIAGKLTPSWQFKLCSSGPLKNVLLCCFPSLLRHA